jgi:iron(III) transport system substrate-binding protein
MHTRARLGAVGAIAALAMTTAACGGSDAGSASGSSGSAGSTKPTLTVYNAQHEQLLKEIVPGFTKATGIKVQLRNGDDFELGNQLVQEGSASPADVFLTENSPAMSLVDGKGLFSKLDASTLAQVPKQFEPADGDWTGFAARSTVLVYNKAKIKPADLPTSIMDLAKPTWKGRVSFSPSGADFQAIVSAVAQLKGEAAAKQWLTGLKDNGKVYQGNNVVLQEVNRGSVDTGIIYHYYWYRDQAESGANSNDSALHFFGNKDPGAFVSVSGAGVLKSSDHPKEAQQFVRYLSSVAGQKALAGSYALEYTLNPQVPANSAIKPFTTLDPPTVEISQLNGPKVIELMQGAGLL